MALVRLTGYQMSVADAKAENLPRIIDAIKKSDSDFVVFPEMSLTGHHGEFSPTKTEAAWEQIATVCRQTYTTAIVGTGAELDGNIYNQARVFSAAGEVDATQDKLIPTKAEREWCTPGESLNTFAAENLTFGCLISNDFWVAPGNGPYPDRRLSYQLGEKGVQMIFLLADTGIDPAYTEYYESNIQLRAREAGAFVFFVNTAAKSGTLNCPSGVVNPKGEWVARVDGIGEAVLRFDLGD